MSDRSSEIRELEKTIKILNEKLKEAESLKSNFISNVMNEVYNPFSSIISMSENIVSLKDNECQKAKEMASIIHKEASQLDFHLENVFIAATIEAGLEDIRPSKGSILKIQESVLNRFLYIIRDKKINVVSNINKQNDFEVYTDIKKITLILSNIISNSLKFVGINGVVEIGFYLHEGKLIINVSDNGPGILSDDISIIFDRFKKVDSSINSVSGGAGIGLSVVASLIDILDGQIEVDGSNGTKISVTVPIVQQNDNDDSDDDIIFFDEQEF